MFSKAARFELVPKSIILSILHYTPLPSGPSSFTDLECLIIIRKMILAGSSFSTVDVSIRPSKVYVTEGCAVNTSTFNTDVHEHLEIPVILFW